MNTPAPLPGIPIAAVERDTGLSKDLLRVWERRYGFPTPLREAGGERSYPPEQLEKLRLIKRLIDHGLRPARLMGASTETLAGLLDGCAAPGGADRCAEFEALLHRVRLRHHVELRCTLQQMLLKHGLQRFVCEVVAPMNARIGDAWLRGEIEIADEHLYTEHVQNLLRTAIGTQPAAGLQRPRVLLTTFPDERHALGLLMVEAMLTSEGAACLSLGTQTPVRDIAGAAAAGEADIVALSFSIAHPLRPALDGLRALREALPAKVDLWVGGAGVCGRQDRLPGIRVIERIEDCVDALGVWRAAHPA